MGSRDTGRERPGILVLSSQIKRFNERTEARWLELPQVY